MKRLLFIALLVGFGCEEQDTNIYPPPACTQAPPSCADGIDNNGDGNPDDADSGCTSIINVVGETCYPDTIGEFYLPYCNDGINNDSTGADGIVGTLDDDNLTDLDDPDCRLSEGGTGEVFIYDCFGVPPFCEDGIDNDQDGTCDWNGCNGLPADEDCDYDSCSGDGEIPTFPRTNCSDGIDNDGDELTDIADPDCLIDGLGEYYLPNCNDGEDNDMDGLIDLEDPDCRVSDGGTGEPAPLPIPPRTNCSDGIDNNGDGLTDLDDPDCTEPGTGEHYLSNCNDGVDQDVDGLTDLEDPDCQISAGGTGEFLPPLTIPEALSELGSCMQAGIAYGEFEGTQCELVFNALAALIVNHANAAAVEEIESCLTNLGSGGDLTDPVTVAAFTEAISATIEETGELPPCLDTINIDTLMSNVANDSVLSELLASFDLSGRNLVYPPVPSAEPLFKSFGTQDYEECIDACAVADLVCSDNCFSGVQGQYDACVSTANTTHSECSADVETNFTDCNANAETARTSCISIITAEYDQCVANSWTSAQNDSVTCMAWIQANYDGCVEYIDANLLLCSDQADSSFSTCATTANTNKNSNMATAMEQFNLMMVLVAELQADPDMAGYAVLFQTLGLILFTNNIQVTLEIYIAVVGYCGTSQVIQNNACQIEYIVNGETCTQYVDDSGCNDYTPPDLTDCVTYRDNWHTQCNTQYSDNMSGCLEYQNNGNTGCSAELTSALNSCQEIIDSLDCSYCSESYDVCVVICWDQFGEGGG